MNAMAKTSNSAPATTSLVNAATRYASAGYAVFPLIPGQKKPMVANGFGAATTDIIQIQRWWKETPNANIGISTGRRSGFFVLDVDIDPENGINGLASLEKLENQFGPLPSTWRQRSPRGGLHIFFQHPPSGIEIRNSASKIGMGLDIRGEGGYITMAPSETPAGAYAWEEQFSPTDTELAAAPDWLISLLRPRRRLEAIQQDEIDEQAIAIATDERIRGWAVNFAQKRIDYICDNIRSAAIGTRNTTLFTGSIRIGELIPFGLIDFQDAFDRLLTAALQAGEEEGKSRDTIQRALNIGRANPRRLKDREEARRVSKATGQVKRLEADANSAIPDHVAEVFADDVEAATRLDGGYPFVHDVIEDLSILKARAPQWWARLLSRLEALGVSKRELTRAMAEAENSLKARQLDEQFATAAEELDNFKVHFFGRSEGVFYYRSQRSRDIIGLSPKDHTSYNLMSLAPLAWWMRKFPNHHRNGVDWQRAADWMIEQTSKAGTFAPSRIRGRGAWLDEGRVVFNAGDHLLVNGEVMPNSEIDSGFIYEEGPRIISLKDARPLSAREAETVLNVSRRLRWADRTHGTLFAGWMMTSVIAGCLPWRSHIWKEAPAGSGKSWIMTHIMRRLIGPISLAVQGETTEPGLRRALGSDAIPVLFDEIETDKDQDIARVERVKTLARSASSSNDAPVLKGKSTNANGRNTIPQATFCFASIGVMIDRQSDATRFTVLSLRPQPDKSDQQAWEADRQNFLWLEKIVNETFTPTYCSGFIARAVQKAPLISQAYGVFVLALTQIMGSRRLADQLGTMFAGSWFLAHDEMPTEDQARQWIIDSGFIAERFSDEAMPDHVACMNRILSHILRIELPGEASRLMNVSEALQHCRGTDVTLAQACIRTLDRHGIAVVETGIEVSNTHEEIAKMLAGSSWATGKWGTVLKHFAGAAPFKAKRIGGIVTRGHLIPWSAIGFPEPSAT